MRPRLLELLRCPKCQSRFEASCFEKGTGDEIAHGVLTCGCGTTYPIVCTIPRVLDNALELFPGFRRRYGTGSERHGRPQSPIEATFLAQVHAPVTTNPSDLEKRCAGFFVNSTTFRSRLSARLTSMGPA